MPKVIRGTLTFEFVVDKDEVMMDMWEAEQIEYVKESIVEDIMGMNFGNSNDLYDAIEIEVINVK